MDSDTEFINLHHFYVDATFRHIMLGVFGPLAVMGVLGNILILYVIGYKKAKMFGSDVAICIMAVYEMLYVLVVVLIEDLVVGTKVKYTKIGCKLLAPLILVVLQTNLWLKAYVSYSRMR